MKALFSFTVALALLALLWTPRVSLADQAANAPANMTETDVTFKCSKLSDLNVYHRADTNKKLGNLDNLIINAHTSQVLYGVLDTGMGGKKILVPWSALQVTKSSTASGPRFSMTLSKTAEELAQAKAYDPDHRPNFTDAQWKQSVDQFFGVRMAARPERPIKAGELTTNQMIFRSSRLSDLNVYNRADTSKKLGNLDDLIINAHSGRLLYGILDTGLGGKNIAVPWNALQLQKAVGENKYWLTLSKTTNELADAPTFHADRMSDLTDASWQQKVDQFFGVRTAARPEEQR